MAETTTIKVPAIVTLENKSEKAIGFVPYRENFTVYVPAGDKIELEAATAGQVFYYLAQATEGLEVTQTVKGA
jgi:hypothetical protein